jgi:hypothetical protein
MGDGKAAAPCGAIAVAPSFISVDLPLWPTLDQYRRDPPNETGGKRGWLFPKDLVDAADAAGEPSMNMAPAPDQSAAGRKHYYVGFIVSSWLRTVANAAAHDTAWIAKRIETLSPVIAIAAGTR